MKIFATDVCYYSRLDEDLFFEGLYRNPAFRSVKGVHRTLHIDLDARRLTWAATCDLVALFYRYGIDLKELSKIAVGRRRAWIKGWLGYIDGTIVDDRNLPVFRLGSDEQVANDVLTDFPASRS